jgi:hypothetical protein
MIAKNFDIRHIDTRWAMSDTERQEVRRQRQREALGLAEPRVKISESHLLPTIAQFAYVQLRELA